MSGGSMNYVCFTVENECVGCMRDAELDDMMRDIANLLHDLEWWQSCDYGEDDYRKTVREFKKKWFKTDRIERIKGYIDQKCADLKDELLKMIEEET